MRAKFYNTSGLDCLRNISSSINDNLIVTSNVYAALKVFSESLRTVTVIGLYVARKCNGAPLEYSVSKSSLRLLRSYARKVFTHECEV